MGPLIPVPKVRRWRAEDLTCQIFFKYALIYPWPLRLSLYILRNLHISSFLEWRNWRRINWQNQYSANLIVLKRLTLWFFPQYLLRLEALLVTFHPRISFKRSVRLNRRRSKRGRSAREEFKMKEWMKGGNWIETLRSMTAYFVTLLRSAHKFPII